MWVNIALMSLIFFLIFCIFFRRKLKKYGKDLIRKSSLKVIRRFRVRLDRFKLTRKKYIKFQLLKEREIWEEMERYAEKNGISREEALERVEGYIDEILPFFNILSYYKFGYTISHFLLNLIYNVVIDRDNFRVISKIPKNSVVIYIMNHRSNADYVLVAYMLAEHIALSYAVGEWARIWPLEYIFKSFGSYFIRRKYREPLYHRVLEKYVQLISKNGITQGIFIEGGLSRDGRILPSKVGLMDYIIRTKLDPDFTKDILFVPTAINYDRVLEDMNLLNEIAGAKPEKHGLKKIVSGVMLIFKIPKVVIRNGFFYIFKGIRKYGYTSVAFGPPISLDRYIEKYCSNILTLPTKTRIPEVKKFADYVLKRVAAVIPITPVPFLAYAILKDGRNRIPETDLIKSMTEIKKELIAKDARIVMGNDFLDLIKEKQKIEEMEQDRTMELVNFEYGVIEIEEMQKSMDLALEVLSLRKIAKKKKGEIRINPDRKDILDYYSNSIIHLFESF
ncbi:MAG: 1-acyl-sn-glycerol-3-phosphate acyltransferase [Deltaproteobacteria bacterium]|uniref:1-acyl-sn-glycerol-3-phosphate acyltransferase n=1 Tax=Candidatus Zymogenus saltonus TaxID=2844893 RepID=A0A9D8KFD4_9DELT|nr:1-acyl-sn-glycerol-3-phosphate acyltransferase [Candidatus Zymogenus saltonus]